MSKPRVFISHNHADRNVALSTHHDCARGPSTHHSVGLHNPTLSKYSTSSNPFRYSPRM